MGFELKRGLRSKFIILFVLTNALCVLLGLILLVTIDKVEVIIFHNLFESVYTVFTQFGSLLFSAIIITQFYIDYKEKNVYFYSKLGLSPLKYYISKVLMIVVISIFSTGLVSFLVCIRGASLMEFMVVFLKIECVMIYYILVVSAISFVIPNFLVAFFVNFALWIIGIITSSIGSVFEYCAFFDASNNDYKVLMEFIDDKVSIDSFALQIASDYAFIFVVFIICMCVVCLFRKRWYINGI